MNRSKNHPFISLFIILCILPSLSLSDNAAPTIFTTICGETNSSNPESFDVSFVNTMETIYQNITKFGFGSAVSGNSTSTVYGLGECFSYLSITNCQLCYSESRVKLPHCLPSVDARIYLDGCFLRYADVDFLSVAEDSYDTFTCGNSTSSDLRFRNVTAALVANLTAAAANVSTGYFQVGSADVAQGLTVYGMAQCWKTLNQSGCNQCLMNGRDNALRCVPATDGQAMNAGCFVRYSTEPFYVSLSSGGNGSSAQRKIIVSVASIIATLAVIGIFIVWKKMKSKSNSSDDMYGSAEIIRSISASHLSFQYEDLKKATDNFNQINKLGQGGYGSVYKGVLPDGREIAVKRLFYNTRQWVDQFFNEVKLVSQVQHKNLVKLLGCSVEGPESLLVYEYHCNTSLDNFLFDAFKKTSLDWERRFEIVLGTAEGLSYLHNASEIRIIHRDIKASNILLDERFKPKIADFGLARYFMEDQSHLSTGLAGTFGYMAPEYIMHGQLTEKADIYSYGVVVSEILTGRKNHNSVAHSADGHSLMSLIWQHFNSGTLMEMLDPSLKTQCTEEQALKLFNVGLLCAQSSPNLRPPMWRVVEILNNNNSKDLPLPTQPPFIDIKGSGTKCNSSESSSLLSNSSKSPFSLNQLSVSTLDAR